MRDTSGASNSQQTYHGACGLKGAVKRVVDGGWIKVNFDPWQRSLAELSFPVLVSVANTKRKETDLCKQGKANSAKGVQ